MLNISKNISAAVAAALLPSTKLALNGGIVQQCQPLTEAISTFKERVLTGDVLVKTLGTGRVPTLIPDPEVSPDLWAGPSQARAPFLTQLELCGAGKDEVLRES